MITVEPNYDKNRIYVNFEGLIDSETYESYMEDLTLVMKKMQPNFIIIVSMIDLKSLTENAKKLRMGSMLLVAESGTGFLIIIIPPTTRGAIRKITVEKYTNESKLKTATVSSISDAEELADHFESEEKLSNR